MGSSPQLKFTRSTEVRVVYGHNPDELSQEVFAIQVLAEKQGYLVDNITTVSDSIWWVSTMSFWRTREGESNVSIFPQRNDGEQLPRGPEGWSPAESGTG